MRKGTAELNEPPSHEVADDRLTTRRCLGLPSCGSERSAVDLTGFLGSEAATFSVSWQSASSTHCGPSEENPALPNTSSPLVDQWTRGNVFCHLQSVKRVPTGAADSHVVHTQQRIRVVTWMELHPRRAEFRSQHLVETRQTISSQPFSLSLSSLILSVPRLQSRNRTGASAREPVCCDCQPASQQLT